MTRRAGLLLVGLTLAVACDGPSAGEVTLVLRTPNTDDGAIAFSVMVAAPNEVTGATAVCDGCDVFYTKVSRTELRGIVTGDLVAGPLVRLSVAQGGPNEVYRLDVVDVANRKFDPVPPAGYYLAAQR
jgi:hypothetical protein